MTLSLVEICLTHHMKVSRIAIQRGFSYNTLQLKLLGIPHSTMETFCSICWKGQGNCFCTSISKCSEICIANK